MDDVILSRAFHVIAVILWIGGLAFVTCLVIPTIRRSYPPAERLAAFHRIEGRFAPMAGASVLLAGATGLWMTWRANLWDRFADPHYWWMHAMVVLWLVFAVMLFVIEPLVLHRRLVASPTPERDFTLLERAHWLLLALSMATVFGAVAGSHGAVF